MPEIKIFFSNVDISKEAYGSKDNVIANSRFLGRFDLQRSGQTVRRT
jgi:hypothetical protein